eukprot:529985-Pelagomonas_calceolata.AAC.7
MELKGSEALPACVVHPTHSWETKNVHLDEKASHRYCLLFIPLQRDASDCLKARVPSPSSKGSHHMSFHMLHAANPLVCHAPPPQKTCPFMCCMSPTLPPFMCCMQQAPCSAMPPPLQRTRITCPVMCCMQQVPCSAMPPLLKGLTSHQASCSGMPPPPQRTHITCPVMCCMQQASCSAMPPPPQRTHITCPVMCHMQQVSRSADPATDSPIYKLKQLLKLKKSNHKGGLSRSNTSGNF